MGYTSDITNTINNKRYVISTVQHARTGEWETGVFERKLFGIPNMLHPILRMSARNESQARIFHGRVEELVAQRSPTDWGAPSQR